MPRLSTKHATLLALLFLIAVAPVFFPSSFYYRVGALIFVNALAVTGLVVLLGYAGQISLGHAGFAGLGAYACALGPAELGLPPSLSLVAGAVVSGLLAWLVGRPILRLKGHYLAVATLGLGILVSMVLSNESQLTGGPDGMPVADLGLRDLLGAVGVSLKSAELWYWFSGLILLLGGWLALNLQNSPSGRALRSLHDSEVAAGTLGVDVARSKLIAFVISAVYASVSGSLLALMNGFVTPDVAGFLRSIELVTMTVLGGAGTVLGAVTGTAILTALPQALTVLQEFEHILFGLTMMLVGTFLRDGLFSGLFKLLQRGWR